jgi:hypothetical protein
MSGERVERQLAAILPAGVAGYSRLMGEIRQKSYMSVADMGVATSTCLAALAGAVRISSVRVPSMAQ